MRGVTQTTMEERFDLSEETLTEIKKFFLRTSIPRIIEAKRTEQEKLANIR